MKLTILLLGRSQYSRSWDKARVSSMVTTFVESACTVYMQQPLQHQDYLRLKECMKKSYAENDCKPSIVAANMVSNIAIISYFIELN